MFCSSPGRDPLQSAMCVTLAAAVPMIKLKRADKTISFFMVHLVSAIFIYNNNARKVNLLQINEECLKLTLWR